jgi:hypothetical protein
MPSNGGPWVQGIGRVVPLSWRPGVVPQGCGTRPDSGLGEVPSLWAGVRSVPPAGVRSVPLVGSGLRRLPQQPLRVSPAERARAGPRSTVLRDRGLPQPSRIIQPHTAPPLPERLAGRQTDRKRRPSGRNSVSQTRPVHPVGSGLQSRGGVRSVPPAGVRSVPVLRWGLSPRRGQVCPPRGVRSAAAPPTTAPRTARRTGPGGLRSAIPQASRNSSSCCG